MTKEGEWAVPNSRGFARLDFSKDFSARPTLQYVLRAVGNLICVQYLLDFTHAVTATFCPEVTPNTSLPSQNLGNSFPGMKCRSTLSFVMTHIRMQPPDEPSRDIANARAKGLACILNEGRTVFDEAKRFGLSPSFLVGRVAVAVHVGRAGAYKKQRGLACTTDST